MTSKFAVWALILAIALLSVEGNRSKRHTKEEGQPEDANVGKYGSQKEYDAFGVPQVKSTVVVISPKVTTAPPTTTPSTSQTTTLSSTVTTPAIATFNVTTTVPTSTLASSTTTKTTTEVETTTQRIFEPKKIGMIGVHAHKLPDVFTEDKFPNSTGDCQWAGSAPFCDDWRTCPSDEYKVTHEESSAYHFKEDPNEWDPTFGHSCWSRSKIFCCKLGSSDPTWAGTWRSVNTSRFMTCTYDETSDALCGKIECVENKKTYVSNIGLDCSSVDLKGQKGNVVPGLMVLENETYYKVGLPEKFS